MQYLNFDLDAFDHKTTPAGDRFSVRVAASPAGEQAWRDADKVTVPVTVRQYIGSLQRRQLTQAEMITLGGEMGKALFPPRVRSRLDANLNLLKDEQGLRIRLRLDTYGLAELPWEFAYLASPDTPTIRRGLEGFLVLNRRLSLVRYEIQDQPVVSMDAGVSPLRLVALLASPADPAYGALNVAAEQRTIEQAVGDLPAIHADFYPNATRESLGEALVKPAHIFHFSGHGTFQGDMGERYGSLEGAGSVILVDDSGAAKPFPAQKLALTMRGRSVRLAVLMACEGGQRDASNAWAGVVTALTQAGIPAVIGMQYSIRDTNALAFSKAFYRALAAGQPIDAAVSDGRLAILNRGDDNERDWGVPVLYLRGVDGVLFPRGDTAPAPRVIATEPANGQTNVSRNLAAVKITFDRDMQPGKRGLQAGPGGAFGVVGAGFDYDAPSRTFIVRRDNARTPLPASALINIDVNVPSTANDFTDLSGMSAQPYRFSFTTEAGGVTTVVDKRTLREAMVGAFSSSDLAILCDDIQSGLVGAGIVVEVSLDVIGGDTKPMQVLKLIDFMSRRGYLDYLVKAVRDARPGIV